MMNYVNNLLGYNSSRFRLLLENRAFAELVPAGALVLDAGSGEAPYKDLFKHAQYESADFEQVDKKYMTSTYVCDLKKIPVEDGRFDFIIFNQVMEHLPEPLEVLLELGRVLRVGGKIIYTGPFFYEEHEQPYDFYRYTQFGLRHLFGKANFSIERLDWLEGYFGTIGYQLNRAARYIPWRPSQLQLGALSFFVSPLMMFSKVSFAILSVFFHRLEVRIKFQASGYPKNYIVIAQKR